MTASARAGQDACNAIEAAAPLEVARMFREHRALVERALRRCGVAEAELADARQEVFIVVHRRLAQFEARSRETTWLYGIAYHVACEFRRRAARRHARHGAFAEDVAAGEDAAHALEERDALLHALRAIDGLAPERREVFVLHELCELPMREVAARLRCPLKTAFSRLYAARRALLGELRDAGALALLPPWPWTLHPAARLARSARLHANLHLHALTAAVGLVSFGALYAWSGVPVAARPVEHANAGRVQVAPATAASTPPARTERAQAAQAAAKSQPQPAAAATFAARPAHRMSACTEPPPAAPQAQTTLASSDDFEVFRASAVELRPIGENPLAREAGVPSPPAHVRLSGPVHAVEGVERAFGVDHADL